MVLISWNNIHTPVNLLSLTILVCGKGLKRLCTEEAYLKLPLTLDKNLIKSSWEDTKPLHLINCGKYEFMWQISK